MKYVVIEMFTYKRIVVDTLEQAKTTVQEILKTSSLNELAYKIESFIPNVRFGRYTTIKDFGQTL